MGDEEATRSCGTCHKDVSEANFSLHETHCSRFLCLCPDCQEPVPREHLEQHREQQHTQVRCSECHLKMERCHLVDHQADRCEQRLLRCEFCQLELRRRDLDRHRPACGSRTELCSDCNRYVTLRDRPGHGDTCPATGGSATGGPATGGPATGGSATGSPATGGSATGGSATGGPATGGSATGGSATGGSATGGSATGGPATRGSATGGSATGGSATGGWATGGWATGGSATGGWATGGWATGGSATGGSATGGSAPQTAGKLPRNKTKSTALCGSCLASFPAADVEQHELQCLLASRLNYEEEEEEDEEEDPFSGQRATPWLSRGFQGDRPRGGTGAGAGDPHRISTCPHCHLALPLATLRWHEVKCHIVINLR